MSYYDDLNVSSDATNDEILTAYLKILFNENNPHYAEIAQTAFAEIGDEEKRKEYDKRRYYIANEKPGIDIDKRIGLITEIAEIIGGVGGLFCILPLAITAAHSFLPSMVISFVVALIAFCILGVAVMLMGEKLLDKYADHLVKVNNLISAKNKELYDMIMK